MMILAGDYAPENRRVELRLGRGTVFCNLEAPVLGPAPALPRAPKSGPHLHSARLPISEAKLAFTLANNHMMDYGAAGLEATLTELHRPGHATAGAGVNLDAARQAMFLEDNGRRIGVICCCEPQFGVATNKTPGVAEMGLWVRERITWLKDECDAVVVSVHAAIEMSAWPSPRVQELYRHWIDLGASIVHGHHAHIPQGWEQYGQGFIFYGMGNLAVDPRSWNSEANTRWSVAAEVDFSANPIACRIFTTEIEDLGDTLLVLPSSDSQFASHAQYLARCNEPLVDRALLESLWHETSMRAFAALYADPLQAPALGRRRMSGKSRMKAILAAGREMGRAALGREPRGNRSLHNGLLWYNLWNCMSHHDAIATALGIQCGQIPDLRNEASRKLADAVLTSYEPAARGVSP